MRYWIFIAVIVLSGCEPAPDYIINEPVVQKGDRLLGVGYTEGTIGPDKTFEIIKDSGMDFIEFPLQWAEIEQSPGAYENEILDIANSYYPDQGIGVVLTLNPIDTNTYQVPSDLVDMPLDDPEVIQRYKNLVDYVFSELPDLDISNILIKLPG